MATLCEQKGENGQWQACRPFNKGSSKHIILSSDGQPVKVDDHGITFFKPSQDKNKLWQRSGSIAIDSPDNLTTICFSPDGRLVIAADNKVMFWQQNKEGQWEEQQERREWEEKRATRNSSIVVLQTDLANPNVTITINDARTFWFAPEAENGATDWPLSRQHKYKQE